MRFKIKLPFKPGTTLEITGGGMITESAATEAGAGTAGCARHDVIISGVGRVDRRNHQRAVGLAGKCCAVKKHCQESGVQAVTVAIKFAVVPARLV